MNVYPPPPPPPPIKALVSPLDIVIWYNGKEFPSLKAGILITSVPKIPYTEHPYYILNLEYILDFNLIVTQFSDTNESV